MLEDHPPHVGQDFLAYSSCCLVTTLLVIAARYSITNGSVYLMIIGDGTKSVLLLYYMKLPNLLIQVGCNDLEPFY